MDLFVVNRYDEEKLNVAGNEENILQNLKESIKKNKKRQGKAHIEEHGGDVAKKLKVNPSKEDVCETDIGLFAQKVEEEEVSNHTDAKHEVQNNFTVLGNNVFEQKKNVKMILPPWLAYPTLISKTLTVVHPVKSLLYLNKCMKSNLQSAGVSNLFPVQAELIPWILKAHTRPPPYWPRDVCVSAPTGSGKTLAFVVPIVQILQKRVDRKVRALIVLPVQELANQVAKICIQMCIKTNIVCCLLSTSAQFSDEQSNLIEEVDGTYRSKVDIVITTAGRLVEHLHSSKGFSLANLKFLVIDEADRVMQEIQNDWLYHINNHVQEESAVLSGKTTSLNIFDLFNEIGNHTHKLLFSATLSSDPEKLKALSLFQPKLFTAAVDFKVESKVPHSDNNKMTDDIVGAYTVPFELTQKYCLTQVKYRPLVLYSLIKDNNWNKFLCFTNSKKDAHRLSFLLQQLFSDEMVIEELSSDLNPKQRKIVLDKFSNAAVNGLICSDALARGIDIPNVDVVISYEPATRLPTYIHRIGRTARAGRPGTAVTILTNNEENKFMQLVEAIKDTNLSELQYPVHIIEDIQSQYTKALQSLELAARVEKQELYLVNQKKNKQKLEKFQNSASVDGCNKSTLSIFEKLQANLPETGALLKKENFTDNIKISRSKIPAAWNVLGAAQPEVDGDSKKSKKRSENRKLKFQKLAQL